MLLGNIPTNILINWELNILAMHLLSHFCKLEKNFKNRGMTSNPIFCLGQEGLQDLLQQRQAEDMSITFDCFSKAAISRGIAKFQGIRHAVESTLEVGGATTVPIAGEEERDSPACSRGLSLSLSPGKKVSFSYHIPNQEISTWILRMVSSQVYVDQKFDLLAKPQ